MNLYRHQNKFASLTLFNKKCIEPLDVLVIAVFLEIKSQPDRGEAGKMELSNYELLVSQIEHGRVSLLPPERPLGQK